MQPMNRIVCTTILLIMISGNAWGAVHNATHLAVDPSDCALCASNANLGAALSESSSILPPEGRPAVDASIPAAFKRAAAIVCPHPRGPPVSS